MSSHGRAHPGLFERSVQAPVCNTPAEPVLAGVTLGRPGVTAAHADRDDAAFVVFGLFTAALIEAPRAAVARLVESERRARASEARTAALLDEMNHRFKNGLQAVGGALHAESKRVEDAARAALEGAAGRLRVLGRLHDRLHLGGERAGVGPVEMAGFLEALCSDLRSTVAEEGRPVAVRA
jgi:hypothetical protein